MYRLLCHHNRGLKAAADIGDTPQPLGTQQQSDKIRWNLPRVRAQSHATKHYLVVERPQVTHVERIGTVLFCLCVALLQPITVQTLAGADFGQNGGPRRTL